MKKTSTHFQFIFCLLLGLLLFTNTATSQTYFYLSNVTINPSEPTSEDEICIQISGDKSTPCNYISNLDVSLNADTLLFKMCWETDFCIQVLEAWDTIVCVPPMAAGAYALKLDGCFHSGIGNVYDFEVTGNAAAPTPDFSIDNGIGCDEVTVNFTNTSTNADTFLWEFGDGNTSTDENPTYTFTEPGEHCVTLTATNSSNGDSNSITVCDMIEIIPSPIPDLGVDTIVEKEPAIILDPGGPFGSYLWNDGSTNSTFLVDGTVLGVGTYTFSVVVTDESGNCTGEDEITITIIETNNTFEIGSPLGRTFYPNPAKNLIYLETDGAEKVLFYDSAGKLVLEKNFSGSGIAPIEVSGLSTGVHYLKVITKNGLESGRFIKN